MKLGVVVASIAWAVLLGCSSQTCPAVPLHCACTTAVNGSDPVCLNGQWVCQCIDGGASDGAAE